MNVSVYIRTYITGHVQKLHNKHQRRNEKAKKGEKGEIEVQRDRQSGPCGIAS